MLNKFCSEEEWTNWLTQLRSLGENNFVSPILVARDNDLRPHIEIDLDDEIHVALLDSGESINCIDNNFHEYFLKKGYVLKPMKISARVANGAKAFSPGILTLPVSCENKIELTEFLVTPSLMVNFILGIGFGYSTFGIGLV